MSPGRCSRATRQLLRNIAHYFIVGNPVTFRTQSCNRKTLNRSCRTHSAFCTSIARSVSASLLGARIWHGGNIISGGIVGVGDGVGFDAHADNAIAASNIVSRICRIPYAILAPAVSSHVGLPESYNFYITVRFLTLPGIANRVTQYCHTLLSGLRY